MADTRYLTRLEAAEVCGCSVDTLRRDERTGQLPNCRARADGVIEISIADLVACGRLDPLSATAPLSDIATKSRIERELLETRQTLALRDAHVEALRGEVQRVERELKRADGEIHFLRDLARVKELVS